LRLDRFRSMPKGNACAGWILGLGFSAIAIPWMACIAGLIWVAAFPGCHCGDDGCAGCWVDGLVDFLLFDGATVGLVGFAIFPASMLVAGLIVIVSTNRQGGA
jgi:hypothetical protein